MSSFAGDIDAPPGRGCAAETASECLFPQHPLGIIEEFASREDARGIKADGEQSKYI